MTVGNTFKGTKVKTTGHKNAGQSRHMAPPSDKDNTAPMPKRSANKGAKS